MEFLIKSGSAEKQRCACLVVPVWESRRLSPMAEHLDQVSQGYIANILRRGDLEGSCGQSLLLHHVPNVLSDRVLLVGCGREREFEDAQYRSMIQSAVKTLENTGSTDAVFYITELALRHRDLHWKIREAVIVACDSLYRFDRLKSKKNDHKRPLRRIILTVPKRGDLSLGEKAIEEGSAIADGISLARDLGNLPANICTPEYLANQALELADSRDKLKTQILNLEQMQALKMDALLSVARGSRQPPAFIIMEHRGSGKRTPPIVLVGKGVTFDAGGISLKPAQDMDQMKFDMCGAAAVMGVMSACAALQLPLDVIALIPATENLPDGQANKPGDIITSMAGLSIEILNTDAEGRLILCDALCYAERYNPRAVIDVATLTGACVVALGKLASAVYSNHQPLLHALEQASQKSGDLVWPMPLWEEYQQQLNSNFADMANVGGRDGGSITAACFLSRFAKKYHWAHLDIAGTAWRTGDQKGATGRPVPLLMQYLMDQARLQRQSDGDNP